MPHASTSEAASPLPEALQRRRVRWFHIPKAGSALINVIARYACPALVGSNITFETANNFSVWWQKHTHPESQRAICPRLVPPWVGHTPIRAHEVRGHIALAGMFRAPAQRLISGFHHTEYNVADSMIAPGMAPDQRKMMQRGARGDPGKYARWPGIAGCATKMLLGWQCASAHRLSAADTEHAIHVLSRFAFVGLIEQWAASVCIFHALMSRGSAIVREELTLTHAGAKRTAAGAGGSGSSLGPANTFRYDESALRGFVDVHDERVYAVARRRFWADARRTQCDVHAAGPGARNSSKIA